MCKNEEIDPVMPAIYIHIPFCAAKCPYCAFPVVVGQAHRETEYLDALAREARCYAGRHVASVYVGGGTPSVLSPEGAGRLREILADNFSVDGAERTVELNPESVTPGKAGVFRSSGFTRMSLGMQSFNEEHLSYLGRAHGPEEGFRAFQVLRDAGFDNINVDLMFGFPGQTAVELDRDLEAVLSLKSEHVSLYALTVEERSAFRVQGEKVSDEVQAEFYRRACDRLEAAGVRQYEVSNFARPGSESRHNLNYWQGGEYIGLGMGAHAHLDGERSWNAGTLPQYLQMMRAGNTAVVGREKLAPAEKLLETFLCGLRMNAGVDMAQLERCYGVAFPPEKLDVMEGLIAAGFLIENDMRLCATDKGRLVLDEISARLI